MAKGTKVSGRPATGMKLGEKASEYPRLTMRLPPATMAELDAASRAVGLPQWRVIVEAVRGVDSVVAKECHPQSPGSAPNTVLDRILVPADAVATGGDSTNAPVGILSVQAIGGLL